MECIELGHQNIYQILGYEFQKKFLSALLII